MTESHAAAHLAENPVLPPIQAAPPPLPAPTSRALPPPFPSHLPTAPPRMPPPAAPQAPPLAAANGQVVSAPVVSAPPAETLAPAMPMAMKQPPAHAIENGSGKAMATGILAALVLVAAGGGYVWHQRSLEQARAEKALADRDATEQQRVQAQAAAAARELAQREQAEQERRRLELELAQARQAALDAQARAEASAPTATPTEPASAPSTDGLEQAKAMLSNSVPTTEADRRKVIMTRLSSEDAAARSRLDALPASRVMAKAGIDAGESISLAVRLQTAALAATGGARIEPTLQSLDALPRPAHADRKTARAANDEGLKVMAANRFEAAIEQFNRALAADPADIEVLSSLSFAYLKNGQPLEAIRTAELAIRLAPRRGAAWNQMAVAFAQRGADWLAVRAFVTLYMLSENQANTREFLGRLATDNADVSVREAARKALLVVPDPAPAATKP